jgi:hypothetical protein
MLSEEHTASTDSDETGAAKCRACSGLSNSAKIEVTRLCETKPRKKDSPAALQPISLGQLVE